MNIYFKKSFAKPFIFLFLLLFVVINSGCSNVPKTVEKLEKIKIGYLPIVHALPLVATAKWYADSDVKVELVKFTSWPELSDALNSGQIDGAVMMLPLAFASKARNIPVQVVALSHRNGDTFIVNKEINTTKELEGKKIAIPHRFSGHHILAYMLLEKENVDKSKVEFIELAPPDMPAALQRGEISGYIVADPFGAIAIVNDQGKELKKAQDIWANWIGNGLVLREEIVKNHPKEIQVFINNFVNSGKRIEENKSKIIDEVKEVYPLDPKVMDLSLKYENYNDFRINQEDFEKLQAYMEKLQLIDTPIDLSQFLNPTFVEEAYKED